MTAQTDQRIPIFICITNSVSGVTSWAFTVRNAFKDHPKYELFLVNLWYAQKSDAFDFNPADLEEAQEIFHTFSPAIIIPNYNWSILHQLTNKNLAFIGMCHSDSEEEYYAPLHTHQESFAKFIAVSDVCGATLTQRLPDRGADIVMLPCGIDVPKAIDRPYQTGPIRLVYGGRIVQKQKRVFDLVDLVTHLEASNVDFVLNIVGEGADCPELKERMSAETKSETVHFLGRKAPAEMDAIWAEHDLFIQVSDFEGTSVSMLEAMGQGTVPVVTAASSGVIGVIEDGKNGIITPVADMQAMAKAIETLASQPESLSSLGKAAHERAKHYSIHSHLTTFTEIIDGAASQLTNARPDLQRLKDWVNKTEAAKDQVRAYKAQLEKLTAESSAKNNLTERQLSQNLADIQLLNQQISDQKNHIQLLEKRLEQSQSDIQALNQQISDHETANQQLEQQLGQSRSDIQALNQQISDHEAANQQLGQQLNQSRSDIQGLNQQISDQHASSSQLERQHDTAVAALNKKLQMEAHKGEMAHEQLQKKDSHIAWLEREVELLNNSFSMRIGRRFYPIKAFFGRLFGRGD